MGPIVFIAADRRECAPWVAKWAGIARLHLPVHWARRGIWRGHKMIAMANGAGTERSAAAARLIQDAAQFWNIGFAGAADPSLHIGDLIIARCVRQDDHNFRCERPQTSANFQVGVVITTRAVIRTAVEKREYFAGGASVVEMEAAGIARAALDASVPFFCVRSVSDLADEDLANDFNAALRSNGKFSAARLIAGAIESPVDRMRELIRLQQRTAIAAKTLGDFLANCEY